MKYRVLIEQDEDGFFVAEVPALPGCVSQGETMDELVAKGAKCPPGMEQLLAEKGIRYLD